MNDTLYAIECIGLKVFTPNGDFVRSVKSESNSNIEPFIFGMDDMGFIYLCSNTDTFPLVKYDAYMNRQFGFGTRMGGDDERISGNQYMLQLYGNEIMSVKRDEPLITLYSRQGEMLLNRRIDNRIFDSRLLFKRQEQEKDPANRKKTYQLFGDIAIAKDEVYLLYTHHDSNNRPYGLLTIVSSNIKHASSLAYSRTDDFTS
ncbi:MAG: hypothetical protein LBP64_03020 [Tannerella sp.]|jgi:hypothetical protein|nr:hypothetical protein [Tannerella sp.]